MYSLMYMVIAGVVAFVMGLRILEAGKAIETSPKKYTEIEKINFWYYGFDTNYLNVSFEVFDDKINCQYFVPDGEQNKLLALLQTEGIIASPEAFLQTIPKAMDGAKHQALSALKTIEVEGNGAKFIKVKPEINAVSLEKEQLKKLHSLEIIRNDQGYIQFLALNEKTLSGSKAVLRKTFAIGIGYVVIIFGGLALLLMPFNMYIQLKDYYTKGTPFYIPNRWQSFKNFFNMFKR